MYIVQSKIRSLANKNGKRVGRSYLLYLERRIHGMVLGHIKTLGSKATLNAEDAEVLDAYRMTRA